MTFKDILLACAALSLAACNQASDTVDSVAETTSEVASEAVETVEKTVEKTKKGPNLKSILAAQSDDMKARYGARHPAATLRFFGVKPGATVAEVLPGGGWYSKIIVPYVGDEGELIGIDYSIPMWRKFGFMTEERLEQKKTWSETWTAGADEWRAGSQADISAFAFGSRPTELDGTADVVLMIRAFHHLTRFDQEFLNEALEDTKALLKPNGVVGIVQHRAPEDNPDDWANGDNGYVKQSEVIKIMEAAGFELAAKSEINANPKDQPTAEDAVWRLPPTLGTSRDNPELRAEMEAIGETDRMTLRFRVKRN